MVNIWLFVMSRDARRPPSRRRVQPKKNAPRLHPASGRSCWLPAYIEAVYRISKLIADVNGRRSSEAGPYSRATATEKVMALI